MLFLVFLTPQLQEHGVRQHRYLNSWTFGGGGGGGDDGGGFISDPCRKRLECRLTVSFRESLLD